MMTQAQIVMITHRGVWFKLRGSGGLRLILEVSLYTARLVIILLRDGLDGNRMVVIRVKSGK